MASQAITTQINLSMRSKLDELEARLQARLGGRIRNLTLLLTDVGVIIRGVAYTFHAKQLAQHAVMEVIDLPIAANEIEVT